MPLTFSHTIRATDQDEEDGETQEGEENLQLSAELLRRPTAEVPNQVVGE